MPLKGLENGRLHRMNHYFGQVVGQGGIARS